MSRFTDFVKDYVHDEDIYDLIPEKQTYEQVYNIIVDYDNNLRSLEKYKEIANKLMDIITDEYGLHLLRVYAYHPLISTKSYHGFDYEMLYTNSIKEIDDTIKPLLKFINVTEKRDKQMLEIIFKEEFDNKYGFIRPSSALNIILNLMRENFRNTQYIKFLEKDLKKILELQQDKYFVTLDLTKKENFKELYKTIGEQVGYPEYRLNVFNRYDGYGNVLWKTTNEEDDFIWGKMYDIE